MSEEQAFLEALAKRPYDVGLRLVFADWLEERDDPRAQELRAKCHYRRPITPQEAQHLAAVAAAREQADASQVVVGVNHGTPPYRVADSPAGRQHNLFTEQRLVFTSMVVGSALSVSGRAGTLGHHRGGVACRDGAGARPEGR